MGRSRQRRAMAVLGCALALLGAGCGDDDDEGGGEVAVDELEAAVVDAGPAGFRAATPNDGLPGGAFDLEEFLDVYSTEEEDDRALLKENGFTGGFTRTWIDETEEAVATVIAFAFEDPEGAKAAQQAFADEARAESESVSVDVPDIPGAIGVNGTEESEQGTQYVQTVSFTSGARLFTVALVTFEAAAEESPALLDLARRQFEAE